MEEKILEEKKFVAFDAAVINVNGIEAAVEISQEVTGLDGRPEIVPVTAVLLKQGGRVTLGGSSRDKFIFWWKENIAMESVNLPALPASEVVVEIEATPFDTPPATPIVEPVAPVPAPTLAPVAPPIVAPSLLTSDESPDTPPATTAAPPTAKSV